MTDEQTKSEATRRARAQRIHYETSTAAIQAVNARRILKDCICGRTNGTHKPLCPVKRRQKYAENLERKRAENKSS